MQSLTSDGLGFYPAADAQVDDVARSCELRYGLTPRWEQLAVSFGTRPMVEHLLFTNGEKDPWRTGVPELPDSHLDLSLYFIAAGAHHEDLRFDSHPPKPAISKAKAVALSSMKRWIARFQTRVLMV